ncbi:MAG: hypothetical protein GWO08_14280 [Gammaproteobacteria bacterium]|nr:hypothetical protein [Gammaproteobacteria bacterium]NIR94787.1 hypothetical protein [Gammaproteobacteria bacterium]
MSGKVEGVTHPANLADGATITETYVDNVTNSIIGLDGALAKVEPIHVATSVDVSNDATENTLFTYEVPANTLGTGNIVRFDAGLYWYNNSGVVSQQLTLKLYYGSTTVSDTFDLETANTTKYRPIICNGAVVATGATDTQQAYVAWSAMTRMSVGPEYGDLDQTFAEDSTTALDFKLTGQLSNAATTVKFGLIWAVVYLVDVS